MRQRVKEDSYSNAALQYVQDDSYPVNAAPIYYELIYEASRDFVAMEDTEIVDFHKRKSQGEIFNNAMLQVSESYEDRPATVHWKALHDNGDFYHRGYYEPVTRPADYESPWSLSAANQALLFQRWDTGRGQAVAKAWANVDESELLAYATVGELPETVKWIASLYQRGIKLISLFKAKRIRLELQKLSHLDKVDALSNFWLEMRYALRPLIFEMEQIVNALKAETSPPRKTARGFVQKDSEQTVDMREYTGYNYSIIRDTKGIISEVSDYRAGVLYNVDIENGHWAHVLALDQPLETIYELTKLSFLVDWFFNIGTLISAWTPNAGLTPLSSWVVETHTWSWDLEVLLSFNPAYTYPNYTFSNEESSYGYSKGELTVKRRSVDPSRPLFPSVKVNLDLAKLLDIATISRGLYRSFKQ
jgi:hypothetical protein